jgi:DNA-directed RNA polymerase III subunit RPC3
LVVLIQQNLIYYVEEGSQGTYYEANQGAAYGLVRSGKILDIVQTRYGVVARDLVLDLFLLGHSNVGELIDQYRLKRNPPANGSTHAAHDAQRTSAAQLDSILCDLLEASLLETVNKSSFRSPDDTYNEVEQTLLKAEFSGATKGTKQKEQLKTMIRDKLGALRFEKESWKPTGNKRKADGAPINGTNGSAKRRRYSNGSHAVNGNHAEEDESLSLDVGCSRVQQDLFEC